MAFKKFAEMTLEEQSAWKQKQAEGRMRKAAERADARAKAAIATRVAEVPVAETPVAEDAVPAESIVIKSLAVPGILMDDAGNEWTIPADSLDDDIRLHRSSLEVPNEDKRFYYQFERNSDAAALMTDPQCRFVPVTLKEQGLDKFHVSSEYGTQHDEYFRVGDLVCMKAPVELVKRRRRAEKKQVDAAIGETRRALFASQGQIAAADPVNYKSKIEMDRHAVTVRRPERQGA